jgi:DNA helicase HerA-like ATPase
MPSSFLEAPTNFYLGGRYDPQAKRLTDEAVYYDSRDLVTHAVVVGMTGSGKTGLCISMLEEAVIDRLPAIIIDPKGDITNLLLNFPELRAADFEPWINVDDALRAGQTVPEFAESEAAKWRKGLADWGIIPQRLELLKRMAEFTIYTPGSDSGVPVSVLSSFEAPDEGWTGNEEPLRDENTRS